MVIKIPLLSRKDSLKDGRFSEGGKPVQSDLLHLQVSYFAREMSAFFKRK